MVFIHFRWVFGDSVCVFSGFLVYLLITSNINTLCVLAITRYIIVCKPEYGKIIVADRGCFSDAVASFCSIFYLFIVSHRMHFDS